MDETLLQLFALSGAFWAALLGYAARSRDLRFARHALAGLALGAVLAHLAWALLHLRAVWVQPWALLDPSVGYTVLAVPLGPLLTAPWGKPPAMRRAHLAALFGNLPLALIVARLGCLAAGCCHGTATDLPWGVTTAANPVPMHPVPLYEVGLWLALWLILRSAPAERTLALFLIGFGGIRLLLEPLRAAPLLGPPLIPPAILALAWVLAGLGLLARGRMPALARLATAARGRAS